MTNKVLAITMIAAVIIGALVSCNATQADAKPSTAAIDKDSLVKRGEYLVSIAGCDDCHSPKKFGPRGPEVDMDHRLSGYPADRPFPKYDSNAIRKGLALFNEDLTSAAGPWGISFAANITSDETGLGSWSEARFFKVAREGKFKGLDNNRGILPPMPWQNLSKMTDTDLKSIFAYLQSTKPVKNVVPATRQLAELK
jgi:hypothetical protein